MTDTGRLKMFVISRITALMLLFCLPFNIILGQRSREEPPPLKERLFFGGSFSLQLGTYTDIDIAPVAGLWVLPRISVAIGPSYRFYKFQGVKTDIIGFRTYLQAVILRDIDKFIPIGAHSSIYFHLEDEILSLESEFWKQPSEQNTRRFFVNTPLAGAGLSQHIGRRSSINFTVLWALYDSGYALYSNPEIRVSFIF